MARRFVDDDLVMAKFPGYPLWPSQVRDHPSGRRRRNFYYIFFLGSEDYAWLKEENVRPYDCDLLHEKVNNNSYRKAKQESEWIYGLKLVLGENYHEHLERLRARAREEEQARKIQKLQNAIKRKSPIKKCSWNQTKALKSAKSSGKKPPMMSAKSAGKKPPLKSAKSAGKRPPLKSAKSAGKKMPQKPRILVRFQQNLKEKKKLVNRNVTKASTLKKNASEHVKSAGESTITVNVKDYKKVVPLEVFILLKRCDQGLPSLTDCHLRVPESDCQPEQPPILSPEC